MQVKVRIKGSNNEPFAENDSRVDDRRPADHVQRAHQRLRSRQRSVVRLRRATSQPDDTDPATVARRRCSPDGEFFFTPRTPASTCSSTASPTAPREDRAIIRVDVAPDRTTARRQRSATTSRSRAEARKTVYVLQNDTDPDGDVVAIDELDSAPTASRSRKRRASGSASPPNPSHPTRSFRYSISDGRGRSRIRRRRGRRHRHRGRSIRRRSPSPTRSSCAPGRPAPCRVLLNDYDPEGGVVTRRQGEPGRQRPGPHRPRRAGDLRHSRPHGDLQLHVRLRRRRRGRQPRRRPSSRCGSYLTARPTARRSPAPTRPAPAPARRSTIPVANNDSDPDGDAVRVESIAAQPAFGQASLNDNGTIAYSASPDAVGSDTFRYVLDRCQGQAGDRHRARRRAACRRRRTARRPRPTTPSRCSPVATRSRLDLLRNDYDPDGDALASPVRRGGAVTPCPIRAPAPSFSPPPPCRRGAETTVAPVSSPTTSATGDGGTDRAIGHCRASPPANPSRPSPSTTSVGPVTPANALKSTCSPTTSTRRLAGTRVCAVRPVDDPAFTVGDDGPRRRSSAGVDDTSTSTR